MGKRRDWAVESARQIHDIVSQNGCSREVSVNFIASALRMAHQRGTIEAGKPKAAEKPVS